MAAQQQGVPKQRSYDKAPIYVTCRRICSRMASMVAHMPAKFRYNLGNKLLNQSFELSLIIIKTYRANGDLQKQMDFVLKIEDTCDELIMMLRAADDNHVLRQQDYKDTITDCVNIIKQATGWKNSMFAKREDTAQAGSNGRNK